MTAIHRNSDRVLRRGLAILAALALSLALLPLTGSASADTEARGIDAACTGVDLDAFAFPDIGGFSADVQDAIKCQAAYGVTVGFIDGSYRPGQEIPRYQMALFLGRMVEYATQWTDREPPAVDPDDLPFTDVANLSEEAQDAIAVLYDLDITTGKTETTFEPQGHVSRRDMSSFLVRLQTWLDGGDVEVSSDVFPDVPDDLARASDVNTLAAKGVVQGFADGDFRPHAPVIRGHMALFVMRFLDFEIDAEVLPLPLSDLKLLSFNDFHGRIGTTESPSAAYLSTHMNAIRDAHPDTLFVDAGDLVGGTPVLSNLFHDEPTVEVMNTLGLDVQTVGNHEFDAGQDEILRRLEGGCFDDDCEYRDDTEFEGQDFTTLSSNVIVEDTGETLTYPYDIIEVAGVDVGFIGVTTEDTPTVVHPDGIVGLEFLPEAEAVNNTVPMLEDEGADVIVVLMHEGGRQDGDADQCENFRGAAAGIHPQFDDAVDVVVDGHTHEAYVCDVEGEPLVTQAYQYGEMFTEIDLLFDHRSGEIVDRSATNHEVTDDVDPDPDVVEIIEFYEEIAGPLMAEVVGQSTVEIPRTTREEESKQGNVATDALLDQYDVDFAFQNSGGLRADLTQLPAEDGLYPIRRQDVLEVWPFGNITVVAEIDGETLEEFLANGVHEVGGGRFIQVGGLRIDYSIADADADPFPRGELVNVEYWNHPDHDDGTDVDLSADATYRIATNDFMAAGGDGYPELTDYIVQMSEPLEIDVENYLRDNSPISPEIEGRIVDITPQ